MASIIARVVSIRHSAAVQPVRAPGGNGQKVDAFGKLGSRAGQLAGPCGLNLDPAGNLYVYNCVGGQIQVFDPQHRLIGLWDGPVDDRRQAFAFAPDGLMYQLGPDDTITKLQIELP